MKILKVIVVIILIGVVNMFASCNSKRDQTSNSVIQNNNNNILFSNDSLFTYDSNTNLTLSSFDDISTITDLNLTFPITSVRENGDVYYTVYSLKNKKLAYIVFEYNPNTGVDFYLKDVIEYPSDNSNEKLRFVLEKDLPEKILK